MRRYLLLTVVAVFVALSASARSTVVRKEGIRLPADSCEAVFPSVAVDASMELCFEINIPRKIKSDCSQSLRVRFYSTDVTLVVAEDINSPGTLYEKRRMRVECHDGDKTVFSTVIDRDVNLDGGENYLLVEGRGDRYDVHIGDDRMKYCGSVEARSVSGFGVSSDDDIDVIYFVAHAESLYPIEARVDAVEAESIAAAGDRRPCGIWIYLDRDNDPDFARPGGEYRLAVIPSDVEGEYLVVYLSGATVNPGKWSPGMIKGIMTATPYEGRYRLRWWDVELKPVGSEGQAVIESGILTFRFPLLRSSLRFGL